MNRVKVESKKEKVERQNAEGTAVEYRTTIQRIGTGIEQGISNVEVNFAASAV